MLFEKYKITNILQKKGSVSIYKGIYLPASINVVLLEFRKNINLVKNLDEIFIKILIPFKITNPLEIIDIFKENDILYIVLPDHYLFVKFPFTGIPQNRELTRFLDNEKLKTKYIYFYSNDFLRLSFILVIIRIYLTIKDYLVFYFKPNFRANVDSLFLNQFFSFFNFNTNNKFFLTNMKSKIFIEQNFLQIIQQIEKQINKKKVAIIIDNINYLSDSLKNLLYSLSNYFRYTFPDQNLIVVMSSQRDKIHPLIKMIDKKFYFPIHLPKISLKNIEKNLKTIYYKKNLELIPYCENILQFYFLLFLKDSKIIDSETIKAKNNFFKILEFILEKLKKEEIEIIKLIYLTDYPLNADLISYLLKIDLKDTYKYLNNLVKNVFIFRINTSEGIFYIKFFKIDINTFITLLNNYSNDSLININNFYEDKLKIYEAIGNYFLNFTTDLEKSLFFYMLAKKKKKALLLSINLINLYNDIKLYAESNSIIDNILNNFNLDNTEKVLLLYEKVKILYSSGYFTKIVKSTKEILKILPESKKNLKEEIYYYQAIGYIYSSNLRKSRNIFKFLLRISNNYKIIFYSKFYLLEIDFFMYKLDNFEDKLDSLINEVQISQKLNSNIKFKLFTDIYILKSKYFIWKHDLKAAKIELIKLFEYNQNIDIESKIIHNILYSLIKITENKNFEAILIVSETLPLIENIKELKLYSDLINLMGLIFYNLKIYTVASTYFEKALKIKAQIQDHINSINILLRLTEINITNKNFKKAKGFITKALKLSLKIENKIKTTRCISIFNYIIYSQNSTHLGVR